MVLTLLKPMLAVFPRNNENTESLITILKFKMKGKKRFLENYNSFVISRKHKQDNMSLEYLRFLKTCPLTTGLGFL